MEILCMQLLISCIVSYSITYIIGHVLLSFIKIPAQFPFTKEFSKLCAGFYTVITAWSVYKTKGITINTGILLLFACIIYWLIKQQRLRSVREAVREMTAIHSLPYFGIQLLFLVTAFVFLYLKIENPVSGVVYEVNNDFYFYARIVNHLNDSRIEGVFTDVFTGMIPARNLYHFGELWYAAFFSDVTGQTPFFSFYFQLFSHCIVVYLLGACALIETFFNPRNNKAYLFCFAVLFVCGISFYIPGNTLFTSGDWYNNGLLYQPKYIFSAICIFYSLILIKHHKMVLLVLISMATVLVNTVVAPAVLISAGAGLLLLLVAERISFKELTTLSLIILSTLFFIGVFTWYIHSLNDKNSIVKSVIPAAGSFTDIVSYLKTAFNCFAGQIIKSAISLWWFVLLSYLFIYKNKNTAGSIITALIFVLLLHVSSVLAYTIFHNRVDAVQLWTNIYIPLSSIACFSLLAGLVSYNSRILNGITAAFILLSVVESRVIREEPEINAAFLSQVTAEYNGGAMVFFKSADDFSSVYSKNINTYAPAPYLIMKYKGYNPVCLSVFEIPKSNDLILRATEEEIIRNSVFYRFVQLQKNNHDFLSIEQSQIDFIKKHGVKYAVTYPNTALPKSLQQIIKSAIKNPDEGVVFYSLHTMY